MKYTDNSGGGRLIGPHCPPSSHAFANYVHIFVLKFSGGPYLGLKKPCWPTNSYELCALPCAKIFMRPASRGWLWRTGPMNVPGGEVPSVNKENCVLFIAI